jgi:DNA-binding transcriptional LysR family regulator
VKVTGHFRAGSAAAVNEAAVHGLGVGTAPLWQIRSMVDQGSVELLLTSFEPSPVPVHAVWPATRILPSKVKLFVDLLADRLKREKI